MAGSCGGRAFASSRINNLLEAARLNSGRARWNWSAFKLAAVCDDALDTFRPLVPDSNVDLGFGVAPRTCPCGAMWTPSGG